MAEVWLEQGLILELGLVSIKTEEFNGTPRSLNTARIQGSWNTNCSPSFCWNNWRIIFGKMERRTEVNDLSTKTDVGILDSTAMWTGEYFSR